MWGKGTKHDVYRVNDDGKVTVMWPHSKAAVVSSANVIGKLLQLECCYKIHSRAKLGA